MVIKFVYRREGIYANAIRSRLHGAGTSLWFNGHHLLRLPKEMEQGTVRLSLGIMNTPDEIQYADYAWIISAGEVE